MSALTLSAFLATPAFAAETVTYTYDELGRLKASAAAGNVNSGVAATSVYDPAGNRISYSVSGSSSSSGVFGVIVLPISGFTIIPLTNPAQ